MDPSAEPENCVVSSFAHSKPRPSKLNTGRPPSCMVGATRPSAKKMKPNQDIAAELKLCLVASGIPERSFVRWINRTQLISQRIDSVSDLAHFYPLTTATICRSWESTLPEIRTAIS